MNLVLAITSAASCTMEFNKALHREQEWSQNCYALSATGLPKQVVYLDVDPLNECTRALSGYACLKVIPNVSCCWSWTYGVWRRSGSRGGQEQDAGGER